jgi:hypothetical protein
MLSVALALALAAAPATDAGAGAGEDEVVESWDTVEQEPRLDLALWGGQAWIGGGGGPRSETYGAEATWRFDRLDLGLFGGCYELRDETPDGVEPFFAPVYLLRFGQRFETRNGLLASFTFGAGAAKTAGWRSWFEVALGARAIFGPAFVAGELSFESDELLRLSLGIGVSLF